MQQRPPRIFQVRRPAIGTIRQKLFEPVGSTIDRVLGFGRINQVYAQVLAGGGDGPFVDRVLRTLDISYEVIQSDLARIPTAGPVLVVANHCFGGAEGLILASLLTRVRPDVKVMANYMLSRIPEMRELFIFVDPFQRRQSTQLNRKPIRESLEWLRRGGLLATFPSGEVAHYNLRRRRVVEPPWSPTIARLARQSGASVLPLFFIGRNTAIFHVLGLIHSRLRTVRLPRELLNKSGRTIPVCIGKPIPHRRLIQIEDDKEAMSYVRLRTYNLRNRLTRTERRMRGQPVPERAAAAARMEPVIPPVPANLLAAEVAALPAGQKLIDSGRLHAWHARAPQIPHLLREIGRLREITFRAVGEGTGRPLDLDAYDDHYVHLFLWAPETREVVAAYRLGLTDEILAARGLKGLYTYSLFRYGRRLMDRINPALEMGRSFVRESYQRNYSSLYLLWKGIGRFVVLNPRYRILFGAVSISDCYRTSSRDLLVEFLKMNNFLPALARLVKARTPLRQSFLRKLKNRKLRNVVESLEDVEALIADMETELSGIPILLKQYLKLGGKLLAFNLDPAFGNVLDGLILVDLRESDPHILRRYLGEDWNGVPAD